MIKLFRHKQQPMIDPLEQKLDIISELTKGLGKKEFKYLIDAVINIFETRQSLKMVKTEEEKEYGDINESERKLEKEKEFME